MKNGRGGKGINLKTLILLSLKLQVGHWPMKKMRSEAVAQSRATVCFWHLKRF